VLQAIRLVGRGVEQLAVVVATGAAEQDRVAVAQDVEREADARLDLAPVDRPVRWPAGR
jgi:hypothetical protein